MTIVGVAILRQLPVDVGDDVVGGQMLGGVGVEILVAHRARQQALLVGGLDRIGIERLRGAHLRRGGADRLEKVASAKGWTTGHDSPWTRRDCMRPKASERTPPAAASTSTMPWTRCGLRAAKASAMVPP